MYSDSCLAFGPFKLYSLARVLTRGQTPLPLAPRTFDLLVVLAESKGRLLSKQELLDAVWGGAFVEEASLSFQISTLRKILGEQGASWIETVPKHGYRFNAPVELEPLTATSEPAIAAVEAKKPITELRTTGSPDVKVRQGLWKLAGGCIVLAAIFAAILTINQRKRVIQTVMEVSPITSYPGRETQPSLSPDGRQVAFAWDSKQDGNFHIYVMLIGRGTPIPLTAGSRSEFSPSWSPDGRWIAFCRDTGHGGEIVTVPAQGGAERVIAPASRTWEPSTDANLQALSWFPASDALAVVGYAVSDPEREDSPEFRGGVGGLSGLAMSGHAPNAIYLVPTNGDTAQPITTPTKRTWGDALPAVSPDGRSLAFTRTPNEYWVSAQLYVVALSAAKHPLKKPELLIGKLSPPEWQIQGVAWSPESRDILFSNRGLWSVPSSGGSPVWLPTNSYRPGRFSVSRDGSRLVFATILWDLDIWRMPGPASDGTPEERAARRAPFIASTELETNPQYSPNGRRIAFTSRRSGRLQIWTCDDDGSNPLRLTDFSVSTGTPRWSPDGRYIAFDSIEAGEGDIYVIPSEGGPVRRITPAGSHEDVPSWSADGRWIYYESDRAGEFRLWKTEFPSGRSTQVTTNGGVSAFESPDGKFVYYAKRGKTGLWRMPVEDLGQEELVSQLGHPYFWGMSQGSACFLDPFKELVTTSCLNLSTKRLSTVTTTPNDGSIRPTGSSFAVSPDGRWILYSRIEREEADLMLVDKFGSRPH